MSQLQQQFSKLQQHLNEAIIGQTQLTERILIVLLLTVTLGRRSTRARQNSSNSNSW